MKFFVGVDVGGTTCTVSIGSADRDVLYVSEQFPTHAAEGPAAAVAAIVEHVLLGADQLAVDAADIAAIGLATPGPATLDGVLLKTPNLNPEHWNRFPIRRALEDAFRQRGLSLVVHYVGDGQAAALGEFSVRTGAVTWSSSVSSSKRVQVTPQEGLSSLLMVIVGTGLGGGEVRDRRLVRGREGRAGHVGHMLLPEYAFRYPHDRELLVGNATCTVEAAVSLTGLTHQLAHRLTREEWREHPLQHTPGTVRDKAKRLRELADQGDALALQLFDDQARALGLALLSANYLGDYDLLVIGGGVCDLSETVRQRYRQIAEDAYRTHALDGFRNLEHFEFSACGDEAPVIGALTYAYEMPNSLA